MYRRCCSRNTPHGDSVAQRLILRMFFHDHWPEDTILGVMKTFNFDRYWFAGVVFECYRGFQALQAAEIREMPSI